MFVVFIGVPEFRGKRDNLSKTDLRETKEPGTRAVSGFLEVKQNTA
jgi:hypothetical protein